MLQRLRETLAFILVLLLPFHAFMVTVLTKLIAGAGHAPLGVLAIWKEAMLAVILGITLVEILFRIQYSEFRKKIDMIDGLIIALLLLGLGISFDHHLSTTSIIYGLRYDFVPLVAFMILRRVQWSEHFLLIVTRFLCLIGVYVAVIGILSLLFPISFFEILGYSDLHSLYVPDGALAAFQDIGGTSIRRIQSTFSGPNQMGLWLLIPIAIVTSRSFKLKHRDRSIFLVILLLALILTLCRAAWIGAAVIIGFALWPVIKSISRRAVIGILCGSVCVVVFAVAVFPSVLLRVSSTRGHLDRPLQAIAMMQVHPIGLGLGTAGPATNHTSDACVMLRPQDDPSWAKPHPNLCVFLGDKQVQPVDRVCHCPFLPENWYLQIGVEMGWVGLALYILLVLIVLQKLWKLKNEELRMKNNGIIHFSFFIFLSISISALFLHAWEDSAVAYTVWILLAAVLTIRADT